MTDPFNGERWNPSGRYLVRVMIGCAGDVIAIADPECVTDSSMDRPCTSDSWTGWITIQPDRGTTPALIEGIKQAEAHFKKVHTK